MKYKYLIIWNDVVREKVVELDGKRRQLVFNRAQKHGRFIICKLGVSGRWK